MDKAVNDGEVTRWPSVTVRIETACGRLYATYLHDDAFYLRGVILDFGKNGNCMKTVMQVISRISLSDDNFEETIKQFAEVACDKAFFIDGRTCESCLDAVYKMWREIQKGKVGEYAGSRQKS